MVADLGFESAIDADINDTNAFDTQ